MSLNADEDILGEGLGTTTEGCVCTPQSKKCVGNDLQKCSDGKMWNLYQPCSEGCDSITLQCKVTLETEEGDSSLLVYIGGVLLLLAVIIIIVFF